VLEIIEIPVFKIADDENNSLFKGQEYISDKTYEGFRFLEYELNDTQSFYFYFIELPGEQNNRYLWDRIIPKSPFSLYLYDTDDKALTKFMQDYNRYETPLFLAADREVEISYDIISLFNEKAVRYDLSKENYFKNFLKEIIQKLVT
jgi:hypothetical protein